MSATVVECETTKWEFQFGLCSQCEQIRFFFQSTVVFSKFVLIQDMNPPALRMPRILWSIYGCSEYIRFHTYICTIYFGQPMSNSFGYSELKKIGLGWLQYLPVMLHKFVNSLSASVI